MRYKNGSVRFFMRSTGKDRQRLLPIELFLSWVAAALDQVQHEDGGDEGGGAAGAAAQLGQDLPALEGGNGAFAECADAGVGAVDRLLLARQPGSGRVALERVRTVPPAPW